MTETTHQRLRQEVCADAGIPASAAEGFIGETPDTIAAEALDWVRARRGEQGVRDALAGFRAANARETPDQIRDRVARDLELGAELRGKLSPATKTEREIVDDGLALLKQARGPAGLDQGVRRLQAAAIDSGMRGRMARRRNPRFEFDDAGEPDMDAALRAMTGRGSRPMPSGDEQ